VENIARTSSWNKSRVLKICHEDGRKAAEKKEAPSVFMVGKSGGGDINYDKQGSLVPKPPMEEKKVRTSEGFQTYTSKGGEGVGSKSGALQYPLDRRASSTGGENCKRRR